MFFQGLEQSYLETDGATLNMDEDNFVFLQRDEKVHYKDLATLYPYLGGSLDFDVNVA